MRLSKLLQLLFISIFILPFIVVQSCKKNTETPVKITGEDATIVDTGDIAADGCGWQIKVADSAYSPQNLGDQFKINNLKVRIAYHKLTARFYCSQIANNPGNGITEIKIDGIVTR